LILLSKNTNFSNFKEQKPGAFFQKTNAKIFIYQGF